MASYTISMHFGTILEITNANSNRLRLWLYSMSHTVWCDHVRDTRLSGTSGSHAHIMNSRLYETRVSPYQPARGSRFEHANLR